MKMIPANTGTQLHLVSPDGAPRTAVPPTRHRLPALMHTTVTMTNSPTPARSATATELHTPTAGRKTEEQQRPMGATKDERPRAPKKARVRAQRPEVPADQPQSRKR